jgi:hypothetical protein
VKTTSHPTLAAGENGSVAVAYVGTTVDTGYTDMPEDAEWHAYLTTIRDATAAEPVATTTTTVNDRGDPIGMGEYGGTRCRAANGAGIGDFIDIVVDDEGRPWAAYVDVCLETCNAQNQPVRGEGVGLVGTLEQVPCSSPASRCPTSAVGSSHSRGTLAAWMRETSPRPSDHAGTTPAGPTARPV